MNKTLHNKLKENNLRIEKIHHIGGAITSDDKMSGELWDLLYEGEPDDEFLTTLFGEENVNEVREAIDDGDDYIVHGYFLHGDKYGFLVEFRCPAFIGKLGWNATVANWIYAETLDEAIDKAISWAKSYDPI